MQKTADAGTPEVTEGGGCDSMTSSITTIINSETGQDGAPRSRRHKTVVGVAPRRAESPAQASDPDSRPTHMNGMRSRVAELFSSDSAPDVVRVPPLEADASRDAERGDTTVLGVRHEETQERSCGSHELMREKESQSESESLKEHRRAVEVAAQMRASNSLCKFTFGEAVDVNEEIDEIVDGLGSPSQIDDAKEGDFNVVIIGNTGAGKSTLINWLYGCKLRELNAAEKQQAGARKYEDPLCVDASGVKTEICAIGHSSKSTTQSVKRVPIENTRVVLWDVPGFFDTGGPCREIIHAALLSQFMNHTSSSGIEMVLMLAIDENSIVTTRGVFVAQVIDRLANMLGRENLSGVVFCLTKPSKLNEDTFSDEIQEAITNRWEVSSDGLHTVVFDPLNKAGSGMTQEEMLERLFMASPIKSAAFEMALQSEAEKKLLEIVHFSIDRIQQLIQEDKPCPASIETAFQRFLRISSIRHPTVSEGITFCKKMVQNFVTECSIRVERFCYSLRQNPEDKERRIKLHTALFQQQDLCKLEGVFSNGREFAELFSNCESRVKTCESEIQAEENLDLESYFRSCHKKFKHGIHSSESTRLNEIDTFKLVNVQTLVKELRCMPEASDIDEFFTEIDRRCKIRNNRDVYLYGDQHDLFCVRQRLEDHLLASTKEHIEKIQRDSIEARFRKCFIAMQEQTPKVIELQQVQGTILHLAPEERSVDVEWTFSSVKERKATWQGSFKLDTHVTGFECGSDTDLEFGIVGTQEFFEMLVTLGFEESIISEVQVWHLMCI